MSIWTKLQAKRSYITAALLMIGMASVTSILTVSKTEAHSADWLQMVHYARSQPGYPKGSFGADMITAGIIPADMVVSGDQPSLQNVWGGKVELVGNGTGYRIAYWNVPGRACEDILKSMLSESAQTSLRGVSVHPDAPPDDLDDPILIAPVSDEQASTACASETANGVNFFYR